MKIQDVIKELKEMKGREVGSGYFKHIVEDFSNNDTMIDIVDWLENVEEYEVEDKIEVVEDFDEEECEEIYKTYDMEDYIDEYCEEQKAENTYNWGCPISNDINFEIYKDTMQDCIYVIVRVHYFGDVRCHYTDNIYLKFDDDYDMFEAFEGADKDKCFEIDGEKYTISTNFWCEGNTVSNSDSYELDWEEKEEIIEKAIKLGLINA